MQESKQAAIKAIRLHLAARDKRQPWLAAKLHRSDFWMSRRMSGQVSFRVEDLEEIAAVFETTLPELILDAAKIAGTPSREAVAS